MTRTIASTIACFTFGTLGCAATTTGPDGAPPSRRTAVNCMDGHRACHAQFQRACLQAHGTARYEVVGRVPGRSGVVIECVGP